MKGTRRITVELDLTSFEQIRTYAGVWRVKPGEVLAVSFRACLPVLKVADNPQVVFEAVRDALEMAAEAGPEEEETAR